MNLKIIIAYSSISINNKYRENTENVCVNKPVSLLNIPGVTTQTVEIFFTVMLRWNNFKKF